MIVEHESTVVNKTAIASDQFGIEVSPLLYKLMYTHLYDDKEKIVIQELAANAYDAHKAAGKEDVPISISLPTQLRPELIIQDYGIGMSEDFVRELYTTYGASNKRNDNEAVGGFGYGSKSPFAISDAFTVKTTHQGVTTTIACYLDNGLPSYSVFSNEVQPDGVDGTVITIPVSDTATQERLESKVKYLFVLWKTQPEIVGNELSYNNESFLIEETEHYTLFLSNAFRGMPGFSMYSQKPRVSVGPFIYELPSNMEESILKLDCFKKLADVPHFDNTHTAQSTMIFRFGVGDLELSPSRETIEDTEENLKKITERIHLIYGQASSGYKEVTETTIKEFIDVIQTHGVTNPSGNLQFIRPVHIRGFLETQRTSNSTLFSRSYYLYRSWRVNSAGLREIVQKSDMSLLKSLKALGSDISNSINVTAKDVTGATLYLRLPMLDSLYSKDDSTFLGHLQNHIDEHILGAVFEVVELDRNEKVRRYNSIYQVRQRFNRNTPILLTKETSTRVINMSLRADKDFMDGDTIAVVTCDSDATVAAVRTAIKAYDFCYEGTIRDDSWLSSQYEEAKRLAREARKTAVRTASSTTTTKAASEDTSIHMASYWTFKDKYENSIYKSEVSDPNLPEGVTHLIIYTGDRDYVTVEGSSTLRTFGTAMVFREVASKAAIMHITPFKAGTKAGKELIASLKEKYTVVETAYSLDSSVTDLFSSMDGYTNLLNVAKKSIDAAAILFSTIRPFVMQILSKLFPEMEEAEKMTKIDNYCHGMGLTPIQYSTKDREDDFSVALHKNILYVHYKLEQFRYWNELPEKNLNDIVELFSEDDIKELRSIFTKYNIITENEDDPLHSN